MFPDWKWKEVKARTRLPWRRYFFPLFWKGVTPSVIFRDSISQGINFIFLRPIFKTIKFVPISIFQAQNPLHHLSEQGWSFSFSSILCTHSHPDLKFVWVSSSSFHLSQAYLLLWVALLKSLPLTLGGLQGPLLLWFPSSLRSVCWQCLYIFTYDLIPPASLRNPSKAGSW